MLRAALRKDLNQGGRAVPLSVAKSAALAWREKASRPVSALSEESVVCDLLDAPTVNLDGTASAPEYFSRRRRVLHKMLGYAVRRKRLEVNPVSKKNLPEGWPPPERPEEAVDPRSVGSPALVAGLLAACSYVGRRQGPRFVAFFGCMYYALMRPSEVVALTWDGCCLPDAGWGYLTFADASPAAGRAFTDDGQVHEHRPQRQAREDHRGGVPAPRQQPRREKNMSTQAAAAPGPPWPHRHRPGKRRDHPQPRMPPRP